MNKLARTLSRSRKDKSGYMSSPIKRSTRTRKRKSKTRSAVKPPEGLPPSKIKPPEGSPKLKVKPPSEPHPSKLLREKKENLNQSQRSRVLPPKGLPPSKTKLVKPPEGQPPKKIKAPEDEPRKKIKPPKGLPPSKLRSLKSEPIEVLKPDKDSEETAETLEEVKRKPKPRRKSRVLPPQGPPPSILNREKTIKQLLDPYSVLTKREKGLITSPKYVEIKESMLGSRFLPLEESNESKNQVHIPGLSEEVAKIIKHHFTDHVSTFSTNERWELINDKEGVLRWLRTFNNEDFTKIQDIFDKLKPLESSELLKLLESEFKMKQKDISFNLTDKIDKESTKQDQSAKQVKETDENEENSQKLILEYLFIRQVLSWLIVSRGWIMKQYVKKKKSGGKIDKKLKLPTFNWAGNFQCMPETLVKFGLDDINLTSNEILKLKAEKETDLGYRIVWLREQFKTMMFEDAEKGPIKVLIERDDILGTIANRFNSLHGYNRWSEIKYKFKNEPALDSGGVAKEVYRLVSEALFQEQFGLFIRCGGKDNDISYIINPNSHILQPTHHLIYFTFAGRFLARALLENCFIKVNLCPVLYKQLLGHPISYHDLKYYDKQVYASLTYLINDATDEDLVDLDIRFEVSQESFGEVKTIELCKKGSNRTVNRDNLAEYAHLMTKFYLHDRYKQQLYQFMKGFHSILPYHLFYPFSIKEFEALLCGEEEIDIEDFKQNTSYSGEFREEKEKHQVIQWFWEIVFQFSNEEKQKLIQFFTGSSRLPVGGFKELHQGNEQRRIYIKGIDKSLSVYPRAHTCFNHLDIPLLDTKDQLETNLKEAINFNIGFNMD